MRRLLRRNNSDGDTDGDAHRDPNVQNYAGASNTNGVADADAYRDQNADDELRD